MSAPETTPDAEATAEPDPVPGSSRIGLISLVGLIVLLGVTQGLPMVIVVVSLVVMIFLHELGHYVMARRAGMLVTEFFIGFGPRIWSFHRGETEYGIKAIPAGAYVKIVGMSTLEDVDPALESRTYRQGTFRQRLGVAVAGSSMHFLIALVLLVAQFVAIGVPDGEKWVVGDVIEGSAAEQGGLQRGDRVVRFDGDEVGSFADFRRQIGAVEPGVVEVVVERDGREITVPMSLSTRMKLVGTIGEDLDVVDNGDRLVVGSSVSDGVVRGAGIVNGSHLVEVNGTAVDSLDDVAAAAEDSLGGRIALTTRAEGGSATSHSLDLGTGVDVTEPAAFVGVGSDPVLVTRSLPSAAADTGRAFVEIVTLSIRGIGQFLWPPNMIGFVVDAVTGGGDPLTDVPTPAELTPSGESGARPISIVGVAMIGSDLSTARMANLVAFLAQINIFIGVFNLIPLLPFDGGHVVIACYEKLQELRRRSKQRYLADVSRMLPVAYGVVMVLVTVGVLALFVDITRGVNL